MSEVGVDEWDRRKAFLLEPISCLIFKAIFKMSLDGVLPFDFSKKDDCLEAVSKNKNAYCFCSDEMRDDIDVASAAVRNGFVFDDRCVPAQLMSNREFALFALSMSHCEKVFRFVSCDLKNDSSFIADAVNLNAECFSVIPLSFCNDDKLARVALSKNGLLLLFASDRIRSDPDFVSLATSSNPGALRCSLGVPSIDFHFPGGLTRKNALKVAKRLGLATYVLEQSSVLKLTSKQKQKLLSMIL